MQFRESHMMHFILSAVSIALGSLTLATSSPTLEVNWEPGDVAVRAVGGETAKGEVVGVVDVPLERVLDIVMDCEGNADWFPQARDTVLVSEDDNVMICHGRTDLPWPMGDRSWTIEVGAYPETHKGVETWVVPFMHNGEGTVEEMFGGYHLQRWGKDGQQTLVTYEAWVDLGIWIPEPILNWATRRILPGILTGIEDAYGQ